ncbi:MAG: DUF2961 domain-containing protein [Verrucomicrobiae bacterium]|nr:DUF2961 domain-containing protein [Verrucomicrobiae bacterium]
MDNAGHGTAAWRVRGAALGWWLVAAAHAAGGDGEISFRSLLADMTDLGQLAEYPSPAYTCRQFSSYDRASTTPDDPATWFANGDSGKFLRVEERDGRKEFVMMDADGPGAIVRIWATHKDMAGTLRIYLDREARPAIEAPMKELLGGQHPHLPPPFACETSKGFNLYLPIPYARHCKVTSDLEKFYYHVGYRTYAAGTPVVTFEPGQFAACAAELKAAAGKLSAPEMALDLPSDAGRKTADLSIAPGERAELDLFEGERAIRLFRLWWPPSGDRDEPALRACVLTMTFDGETTVAAPLGDFFGSGPGIQPMATLPLTVTKDGAMESRWPMPFRQRAALAVQNHGPKPVAFQLEAVAVPRPWTERSMRFHAKWRIQHDLPTDPKIDWNYLTARGRGVFAGVSFSLDNPVRKWWGEGDEKIYVDGEAFPSHFGTGTEDYFGYAWCSPQLFEHPYHSQSRCDGPGNFGRTSINRFHILDRIPFQRDIRFDMEIWHWEKCAINASVLAYWYAAPGATDAFPAIRPDDVRLRPMAAHKPTVVPGAIEGESLRVIKGVGRLDPQEWDGDSGGAHLWWHGGQKPGDSLLLGFQVPADGKHRVLGRFLKARDYGIAQFEINGTAAAAPIDFYNEGVVHTKEIDLGTFEMKKGENQLGIAIIGANPKAKKAYMVGLDYLRLVPGS